MSDICRYCNYLADGEYFCDPADPNVCEPCQKLSDLQGKIKEIRRMLVGLENERQKLREQANHSHSRFIHRLPPEVAGHIFEFCLPEDIMALDLRNQHLLDRHTLYTPLILSAVCRRWRNIAQSTPQLWKALALRFHRQRPALIAPLLVKEWIDRAGELPLTINLFAINEQKLLSKDTIIQTISVLNLYSHRWLKLKYEGPTPFLSHFTIDGRDLPQLRTLHLATPPGLRKLNLHPTRLNTLSISGIMLAAVNFDWHHLTQLELNLLSLSEFFQALRLAPLLTRCTFLRREGSTQSQYPLPQNPIVHSKIEYLEIAQGLLYTRIFEGLLCPSLKTFVLDVGCHQVGMPLVVSFLRRSRCSLETLSLLDTDFSPSDAILLCQGIPTLQHLHVAFFNESRAPRNLFACLAEFPTVNGRKEPLYLPALRSLDLLTNTYDWEGLPNIFGTPTAHLIECHRYMLKSVAIWAKYRLRPAELERDVLDEDTLARIIWLRNSADVEWKIQIGLAREDLMALASKRLWGRAIKC